MCDVNLLINEFDKIDIKLSDKQVKQFIDYYKLLVDWNERINLTAITEYKDVIIKHFIDSVILCKYMDLSKEYKLIDVGTGAGFPSIPLKIVYPNINIVMLDSLNKRIIFLMEVIKVLNLQGIEAVHSRAEDAAKNDLYREKFDIAVSRAVAQLPTLLEYNMPFVKLGGFFLAYKSGDINEELEISKKAVKILGGDNIKVDNLILPDTDIKRSFVFAKKVKATPKQYPRKAGMPSKEPLK